jgi:hypothetical protein
MQNTVDITMAEASTARWTVAYDHGIALLRIARADCDCLISGCRMLFTEAIEENPRLLGRDFGVPSRPPTTISKLCEIMCRQERSIPEYFEGLIPLVDGMEWCDVTDDALRRWIGIANHHTWIFCPRLDVIYMLPKGHLTTLTRERPVGFTIHGYVYDGTVSAGMLYDVYDECWMMYAWW